MTGDGIPILPPPEDGESLCEPAIQKPEHCAFVVGLDAFAAGDPREPPATFDFGGKTYQVEGEVRAAWLRAYDTARRSKDEDG